MTTLLVKNALIIDGTGNPAYAGHRMADGDRIRRASINGRQVVSDDACIGNAR